MNLKLSLLSHQIPGIKCPLIVLSKVNRTYSSNIEVRAYAAYHIRQHKLRWFLICGFSIRNNTFSTHLSISNKNSNKFDYEVSQSFRLWYMDSFDNDRFIHKSNFLLCYALYNNRPDTCYLNAIDLTIQ